MGTNEKTENMGASETPILIKKYPNRRLYNTTTSAYIVLDDVVKLVKDGTSFVIQDQKTGEDITRSILNQIIFERETKQNNYHFPLEVQKQLIGMYDDAYGKLMPDYLKESMNHFASERERMSEHVESVMDRNTKAMMQFGQTMARQNAEIFKRSWEMFGGINPSSSSKSAEEEPKIAEAPVGREQELKDIQEKIDKLQERLKTLK